MDATDETTLREFASAHFEKGAPLEHVVDLIRVALLRSSAVEWEQNERPCRAIASDEFAIFRRRRKADQRAAMKAIAEGQDAATVPPAEAFSLEEAVERFVLVTVGRQVFDLDRPSSPPLALQDFEAAFAGSRHRYVDWAGKPKVIPVPKAWLSHTQRKSADDVNRPGF